MTNVEQQFFSTVPQRLSKIEQHLEKISNCLEKLTTVIGKLYGSTEKNNREWLEHAQTALDEQFPNANEELKDEFIHNYWQNLMSDNWNFNEFIRFVRGYK